MEPLVKRTRAGAVSRVEMNRPDLHNALHRPLAEGLDTALAEALDDESARMVVLAGAGRTFCAGLDLAGAGEAFRRAPGAAHSPFAAVVARLMAADKPVVARVQGGAFGAGFGLMAACGLAVVAEDARFVVSELRFGLPPTLIPLVLHHTGRLGTARHLLMAGAPFDAATARQCGLAHHVVPAAELDGAVEAACADLLACAPGAYAAARALQRELPTLDFPAGLRRAEDALEDALDGEEGREGRTAWAEGRPPRWAGP